MNTRPLLFQLLFALFIVISPATVHAQKGAASYEQMTVDILKYVNEHRVGIGRKPLTMNAAISAASEKHSRNMATGKLPFGHEGFDERMKKLADQLPPSYSYAENVAYGTNTAKDVVEQWLHSPGHKKNIEGDYNITGIGIAKSKDGTMFYTQIFLKRDK
ncbi:MAG: transporter [Flavipsychrobacter sp.]|nr:transporter [Flavipsychrobacter sp.]